MFPPLVGFSIRFMDSSRNDRSKRRVLCLRFAGRKPSKWTILREKNVNVCLTYFSLDFFCNTIYFFLQRPRPCRSPQRTSAGAMSMAVQRRKGPKYLLFGRRRKALTPPVFSIAGGVQKFQRPRPCRSPLRIRDGCRGTGCTTAKRPGSSFRTTPQGACAPVANQPGRSNFSKGAQ